MFHEKSYVFDKIYEAFQVVVQHCDALSKTWGGFINEKMEEMNLIISGL